jgi:hypothetical protein
MAKTKTRPKTKGKPLTKHKASSKEQFERFVSTARALGVEDNKDVLDRAFDRVVPSKDRGA